MENRGRLLRGYRILLMIQIVLFIPVLALAGGGQHYPNGAEAQLIGVAPPPGFYIKDYNYYYTANKLKDDHGHTVKLSKGSPVELDQLSVYGNIPRFIWISKLELLGGFYGQHLFIPMLNVHLDVDAMTPGGPVKLHDRRGRVGDIIYSPFILSWHRKDGLPHAVAAVDVFVPTGAYDKDQLVNIGKNMWTFEPAFAVTGFLPWDKNLSASIKLMYDFNTRNDSFLVGPGTAAKIGNPKATGVSTHLSPGQEFHFDYGIEYVVFDKLRLGIAGYFYQQVTDDDTGVGKVKDDKGRVFAIGPSAWWTYKKWIFDSHVSFETATRNRPQGLTALFDITYAF